MVYGVPLALTTPKEEGFRWSPPPAEHNASIISSPFCTARCLPNIPGVRVISRLLHRADFRLPNDPRDTILVNSRKREDGGETKVKTHDGGEKKDRGKEWWPCQPAKNHYGNISLGEEVIFKECLPSFRGNFVLPHNHLYLHNSPRCSYKKNDY